MFKRIFAAILEKLFGSKTSAHESRTGTVKPPEAADPKEYNQTPVLVEPSSLVIRDHKLVGVQQIPDPDYGAYLNPKIVLIHFTCSYNLKNTVNWFLSEEVDIHTLIDKDGTIVQMVPFNRCAAHAGKSEWKGYYGLNNHAIGIELINIGPLTKKGSKFYDCYNREWTGDVVKRPMLGFDYWEPATQAQINSLRALIRTLMKEYQIPRSMVCSHHEASPGRKNDVGGIIDLSMDEFRRLL